MLCQDSSFEISVSVPGCSAALSKVATVSCLWDTCTLVACTLVKLTTCETALVVFPQICFLLLPFLSEWSSFLATQARS